MNKIKNFLVVTIIFCISFELYAQNQSEIFHTGNLKTDFKFITVNNTFKNSPDNSFESKEKSVLLSGLFSAIVPGTGEIYSESYLKGGIFLILEAAAWYVNILYNKKGDDQTTFFKNYADDNWSVVRYAEWINTYRSNAGTITINPDETLKPWQRINWDELHSVERNIKEFSHTLPNYGEQQYYELIGKYRQYSSGWKEYDGGADYYNKIPQQMYYYADEHIEADHLYNVAAKAVIFIIVNHILSFADAIWTAINFNSEIHTNFSFEKRNLGFFTEYYPQLNLSFAF